jgi:outer membrane protein assembly factor BamE (lipoprotein component of BamABCDE complex)
MEKRLLSSLILMVFLACNLPPTAQERRSKYLVNHPNLSGKVKNEIRSGQVSIGMTKEQVRASWGYPDDINKTITEYSYQEQWVYNELRNGISLPERYVYFDRSGTVTTIQD